MNIALFTHDSALAHDTGPHHPERPDRIGAVAAGIHDPELPVRTFDAPRVDLDLLSAVHDRAYIEAVRRFCRSGGGALDPDTVAGPGSWEAALRSAGAGGAAARLIRRGEADIGFVVMRPPGHHAEPARAMGFCLFNNIAVTARELTAAGDRVAIVDWDVHHGNGTQVMFYDDPDVLYLSVHQFPFYPGTGWLDEIGVGAGTGATVNIPLPAGSGSKVLRAAFARVIVPALRSYRPDWILISAGYDAHVADPLAELRAETDDYRVFAAAVRAAVPGAGVVAFLEGGYDLAAMRASAAATIEGFADAQVPEPPPPGIASPATAWRVLEGVVITHRETFGLS